MPISVVINTYNAEKHLAKVLESVKEFDEVLICDMESTDGTLEIANRYGCRIITFPRKDITIVEPARNYAIQQAAYEWVLVIDADELVTNELKDFLYGEISTQKDFSAIAIPRKNYFMGRFMHSAYPDYVVRFLKKDNAYWPPVIHTSPKINGVTFFIPKKRKDLALVHLANDSISDIIRKSDNYSKYELPRRRNRNYGIFHLFLRPFFRFFKSYVLKKGFMDGIPGLIHAILDGVYQFLIVAKLLEERISRRD